MTRYLLYSHDSYGLGHFRRSSLIAAGLAGARQDNEVLIVTGSPRAQSFRLPDRVDTIKLPSATKDDGGNYRPRKLGADLDRLVRLRSTLVAAAVSTFEPDTIIVDHAPLGMAGELRPIVERLDLTSRRPRMVLGVRDIIDDAARTDAMWQREGIWNTLNAFDDIFVYGDPAVLTTAEELNLPARCSASVRFTGYVAPATMAVTSQEPYLLVTAGGGGDGQALIRRYLDAVEAGQVSRLRSLIVTGPLLSSGRRAELMRRVAPLPGVELTEFSTDMRSLIASAAGVISMAGYNTVVEEMRAGVPTLLVPRVAPRVEQHLRAQRLSALTHLQHVPLDTLTPPVVGAFAQHCLHERGLGARLRNKSRRSPVSLDGVNTITGLLGGSSPTSNVPKVSLHV